ncbi:hypothetical protein V6N13_059959 [Hibiscus sabdariffa]
MALVICEVLFLDWLDIVAVAKQKLLSDFLLRLMLAAYVVEFLRLMGADDSGTRRDFIDGDIPLPSGCLILHWTDFVCAWRVYSR